MKQDTFVGKYQPNNKSFNIHSSFVPSLGCHGPDVRAGGCGVRVRSDQRRGAEAVTRVWSTLQPLESLEAVQADSVEAGEARHEAQRRGVQTEDVSPEAEAEAGSEYVGSRSTLHSL